MRSGEQLSIFRAVREVYAESEGSPLPNADLYRRVAEKVGVPLDEFTSRKPIGKSGALHSPMARTARFTQQTLRMRKLLEAVPGQRGVWQLSKQGREKLSRLPGGQFKVIFQTDLGLALVGDCEDVFGALQDEIALTLCSPPYALKRARDYGNPSEQEIVDSLCRAFEVVVRKLRPGGNLCVNTSNDIFVPGSPARSLYVERLVLALHDRLGLQLMDRLIWQNPTKPPSPARYASVTRQHLNAGYEHVLWFTNDATKVASDNRRVLEQHSERHWKLMAKGGEGRHVAFSDGAHTIRPGSFGNLTAGKIPRNVIKVAGSCGSQRAYKKAARALGLPAHGAPMPLRLAEFLVKFLSDQGDLVADPFAGSFTTALAAEIHGRRWIGSERHYEYAAGAATRFQDAPGYHPDSLLEEAA